MLAAKMLAAKMLAANVPGGRICVVTRRRVIREFDARAVCRGLAVGAFALSGPARRQRGRIVVALVAVRTFIAQDRLFVPLPDGEKPRVGWGGEADWRDGSDV
jgi:hypothetical protein